MKSKSGIFRNIKSVILRGISYKIHWRKPRTTKTGAAYGLCDPPFKKNKKITIDVNTPEEELLDTIIHESLHGCYWHLNEDEVTTGSKDISHLLWRCGYRRIENPED